MPSNNVGGPVFNVSFSAAPITTNPQDLLGFLSSGSRMELISLTLTQNSSAVTNDQTLGIQFFRGSTASSTAAALTPVNVLGWTSPAASVAVTGPSSVQVSTASGGVVFSESFTVRDGFRYEPKEADARITLTSSQRLMVRMTAPASALTMNARATFRQLARYTP